MRRSCDALRSAYMVSDVNVPFQEKVAQEVLMNSVYDC